MTSNLNLDLSAKDWPCGTDHILIMFILNLSFMKKRKKIKLKVSILAWCEIFINHFLKPGFFMTK